MPTGAVGRAGIPIVSYLKPSLRGKVKGLVVSTGQGWFCVDPDDEMVTRSLVETGAYGLDEIEQARRFVRSDSRLLVVGAHFGTIAVPLSKLCRELVAIEANPNTFEFLERNLLMNGCTNVTAHQIAANDRDEMLRFVLNTYNSGMSKRMPAMPDPIYFHDHPKVTTVHGVRLDDHLDRHDFDLVFMDIEGSEYFAFLGMPKILASATTLMVEFIPHHLSRVAGVGLEQFLEPLAAFEFLEIPSKGLRVAGDARYAALKEMFDAGECDNGIIFSKRDDAEA